MVIAIITPVYPPYGGGMGRVAKEDARVLSMAGNKVIIFTACKHRKLKFGNAAILFDLIWKLKYFDCLHLHYPFFGTAEIVWLMKKIGLLKAKLIITYHMDVVGTGILGSFFKFHTKYIMPRIISSGDKIIVTSFDYAKNSNIKNLIEKFPDKFSAIPIGVDDTLFKQKEKDKELLKRLKIEDDEKIVLFVGGLDSAHYFKGLPFLLKAFKNLEDKKYKLIVVGKGDLENEYKLKAKELGIENNVIFAGGPTRNDLLKYYNLADVFVLPSIDKSEAFGIVLLEAMASGVPIIASNLCGVRTLIEEGKNGFVTPIKDVYKISEKIDEILSDDEKNKKMGEYGRKMVEEKYSYKKVGEQLLNFYENLFNK